MKNRALWPALGVLVAVLPACQTVYLCGPLYHRPGMHFVGVFEGTLPCADCEGITTELVLWSRGPYDYTECWYRLSETYLGKSEVENNFIHEGPWYLERGSGDDPDDTVYSLDIGKGRSLNFVIDDEETLTLLSPRGNTRMVSGLNYSLNQTDVDREQCFENYRCARRCCSSRR